jgi:bacteriocin resistance YdeI/OmpD-like protein
MRVQRFGARLAHGPRGGAVIVVPFDPDEVWGGGDLADDIAAALEASPAAAAFFDTLAQFYRKAYLRWIDATARRPDLRATRIAEVADLLAAGIKQRPRPGGKSTP